MMRPDDIFVNLSAKQLEDGCTLQPDYNSNNLDKINHIQNRPCYIGDIINDIQINAEIADFDKWGYVDIAFCEKIYDSVIIKEGTYSVKLKELSTGKEFFIDDLKIGKGFDGHSGLSYSWIGCDPFGDEDPTAPFMLFKYDTVPVGTEKSDLINFMFVVKEDVPEIGLDITFPGRFEFTLINKKQYIKKLDNRLYNRPDFDQTDPDKSDFLLNKPFGEILHKEYVRVKDYTGTFEFDAETKKYMYTNENADMAFNISSDSPTSIKIQDPDTDEVIFSIEDVTPIVHTISYSSYLVIGNGNMILPNLPNTNETYGVVYCINAGYDESYNEFYYYGACGYAFKTDKPIENKKLSIELFQKNIVQTKKINAKYLPKITKYPDASPSLLLDTDENGNTYIGFNEYNSDKGDESKTVFLSDVLYDDHINYKNHSIFSDFLLREQTFTDTQLYGYNPIDILNHPCIMLRLAWDGYTDPNNFLCLDTYDLKLYVCHPNAPVKLIYDFKRKLKDNLSEFKIFTTGSSFETYVILLYRAYGMGDDCCNYSAVKIKTSRSLVEVNGEYESDSPIKLDVFLWAHVVRSFYAPISSEHTPRYGCGILGYDGSYYYDRVFVCDDALSTDNYAVCAIVGKNDYQTTMPFSLKRIATVPKISEAQHGREIWTCCLSSDRYAYLIYDKEIYDDRVPGASKRYKIQLDLPGSVVEEAFTDDHRVGIYDENYNVNIKFINNKAHVVKMGPPTTYGGARTEKDLGELGNDFSWDKFKILGEIKDQDNDAFYLYLLYAYSDNIHNLMLIKSFASNDTFEVKDIDIANTPAEWNGHSQMRPFLVGSIANGYEFLQTFDDANARFKYPTQELNIRIPLRKTLSKKLSEIDERLSLLEGGNKA